jgi:hypothetical protein
MTDARATTATTIEICTDADWFEPSTNQPAVVQPNGPSPGSIHDIPNAQPIWGQSIDPNSSTTLIKEFDIPDEAINIVGSATLVADDGAVLFLNTEEVGSFDAMIWPPPTVVTLTNLQPGTNHVQADIYNRPSYAWFEACVTITYELSGDSDEGRGYIPFIVKSGNLVPQPSATPTLPIPPATATPSPTSTSTPLATIGATPSPTITPSPTALHPGEINLLTENMPLPTGWGVQGLYTYWEGLIQIQNEAFIEVRIEDCGDNEGNGLLNTVQIFDPANNLIINEQNCDGNPTFAVPTAGKPGFYRIFLQDNDTGSQDGNGGVISINGLRNQTIYADPANPDLGASNLLLQIEPLPAGWGTKGPETYWEGYINIVNEPFVDITIVDCGDNEGNGRLNIIQITDPNGFILGESRNCGDRAEFRIQTYQNPGYYRIYLLDWDTIDGNGGILSVEWLEDQNVYPTSP